jgi:mannitol-specific phosphotransferase system IIBC component
MPAMSSPSFDRHHVYRIGRSLINRFQHPGEGLGVLVAFIFLELYGSRKSSELGGEDWLYMMRHIHFLARNLFDGIGY